MSLLRTFDILLCKSARRLLATAVLLQIAGCGLLHDRTDDYVKAEREAALAVPPWYQKEMLQDDYPVPKVDRQRSLAREFKVPAPPEAELDLLAEEYSIRRSDDHIWLLINEEPGRVWPALARFWDEQGLDVPYTAPKSGLMQTSVTGNSARSRELLTNLGLDPDAKYYFQIKLDQGLRRRTSEVAVRLIPSGEPSGELEQVWQQSVVQSAVEEKLLGRVQTFLEKDEANRSYSLLAQDIAGGSKVALVSDEEPPYLRLNLNFDRAWSSVGKALEEGSVQVVDLNRTEGAYLVNFEPGVTQSSWLPSWLSPGDDDRLSDRYNFRLIFEQVDGAVHVRAEATQADTDRERTLQLLTRILENLA